LGSGGRKAKTSFAAAPSPSVVDPHRAAAVGELAEQHLFGQRLLEMLLDDAGQRPGAEQRS
jgi:hypothetical protein